MQEARKAQEASGSHRADLFGSVNSVSELRAPCEKQCYPSCATAWLLILLAFIPVAREVPGMPASIQNVKKRKARRIKNDRLQAAKKAAKAKG